jgi:hypothetical protein
MRWPWEQKTGLTKAVAILCTIFIISLGLCGMNIAFSHFATGDGSFLVITAAIESLGMLGSLLGLLIVAVLFIVRSIRNSHFSKRDQERGD